MPLNKTGVIHFEPDLIDFSGHIYNTATALKALFVDSGHGYRVVTTKSVDLGEDKFLNCEHNFGKRLEYRNTILGNLFLNPILFNLKTLIGVLKTKIYTNEIIYFNTAQHLHLYGIAFACIFKNPRRIVLTFRLDTFTGFRSMPRVLWYWVGIKLLLLFHRKKLIFVTDSGGLVDRFKKIYNIDMAVLPIPHIPKVDERIHANEKLMLGSLGPASEAKNIIHTIHCLGRVDELLDKKINYLLYSYGQCEKLILKELSKVNFKNINLILRDRPVNKLKYIDDLRSTDIVMVNYLESCYKYNTSGVFSEAFALNKIILTTDKTWMSDSSNGCKGVIIIKEQNETTDAIIHAINNFHNIKSQINRNHSSDSFYEKFMSLVE